MTRAPSTTSHDTALTSAAHRVLAPLSPGEILLQLCRETSRVAACPRVLASYLAKLQQWNEGVHVQLADEMPCPLLPAHRSAMYAVYRRLSIERGGVFLQPSDDTRAVFRGLSADHNTPSSVCGLPIYGGAGRVCGCVVLVDAAFLDEEVLKWLRLLCGCTSTALANAHKFVSAKRDQDRLLIFTKATEEALWDLVVDTGEVWWGGAIQAILGGAIDVGPTLNWKEQRIHPEDRERVIATFQRALDLPEARWQDVYRFERADGSFATVEDRAYVFRDSDGWPIRSVGRLRDITDLLEARRRETEAIRAREQSEERLRLAVETARLGTWDKDLITGKTIRNDLFCELFGIPRGADSYCDSSLLVHPEDRARVQELTDRAMSPESGGLFESEHRIVRFADKRERWMKARGRVYFDTTGKPIRFIGTIFDISDRKFAEERLRVLADASERLAQSLESGSTSADIADIAIHSLADWCFVDVVEDGATSWLQATVAHTNPERTQFAKQIKAMYPSDMSTMWERRVIETGRAECYTEITDALMKAWGDSDERPCMARQLGLHSALVVPMIARGRTAGAISFAMAESGRRYSEADLPFALELARRAALGVENARLYGQAQEAIRLRDEFLSIASHELKTPLTPLQLQLENVKRSLARAGLLDERVASRLEQANRQTQRLSKLVDSLLDVSRISAGRLSLELEDVDLAELVTDVVQRFAEEAQAARSTIELHVEQHVFGRWDRLRIEQVLANLVSNAIKYGAGKPIAIRVFALAAEARVDIEDHGIGVTPEDLKRIFGRFERAVSLRHYGGLGLGLYITRQIMDAHGGTITAQSVLGQGSTFTIVLPLKPVEIGEAPSPGAIR